MDHLIGQETTSTYISRRKEEAIRAVLWSEDKDINHAYPWILDTEERVKWANDNKPLGCRDWRLGDNCFYSPRASSQWDKTEPPAKLSVIQETSLCDVPAKLRELADEIEQGVYGNVGCCAVALLGDEFTIFGFGEDSRAPSAHCLFHAAAVKLAMAFVEHGADDKIKG